MAKKTPRPVRTLLVFGIAVVLLYGAAALGKTWAPGLGLDLQGGTQITLSAAGKTPSASQLNLARSIIDQRVNGSGVSGAGVSTQGGKNIVVNIPGKNATNLVAVVKRTAQLRFRLVAQGSPQPGLPTPTASPSTNSSGSPSARPSGKATSKPTKKEAQTPGASATATATPKPRAAALGDQPQQPSATTTPSKKPKAKASASSTPAASPSSVPGGASNTDPLAFQQSPDPASVKKFLTYTCPAKTKSLAPTADNPDKPLITCDDQQQKYLLSKSLIEGTQLKSASYGTPANGVGWAVNLSFKSDARDIFANVTRKLNGTGQQFAIVLDGKVISAAQVNSPILDGNAQITGSFTQAEAKSLSNSLKYGALPIKFTQPTVVQVGPSLAGNQLSAGVYAGIVGLALVMIYCLLYYRGLGLVVVSSLIAAGAITYAMVLVLSKTAGFTLSLPGIAGLIVAVGITADSFIVYFERIRDEMRAGKSMRVAVELGWARARNTCLAADAVSLLAAVVLYVFTIGDVKGFAFTLGISTLIDLVVFFFFTKPMMTSLARVRFFNSGSRFSGLSQETLGLDGPHPSAQSRVVGGRA
ncbi:MAG: protein translocase subunit SecD [Marmoricola sp.]